MKEPTATTTPPFSARFNLFYRIILLSALLLTTLLHIKYTLNIGFITDDWDLIKSAKEGRRLWILHYAPLLETLWRLTAEGSMTPLIWHLLALLLHSINITLLFLLARGPLKQSLYPSLTIATLFAMNPAGIEAIIWCCCLGYLITATWILLALYLFLKIDTTRPPQTNLPLITALTVLQAGALLTWSWGLLLFPLLLTASLTKSSFLFRSSPERKQLTMILAPVALCWGIGLFLRSLSTFQNSYQDNNFLVSIQFLIGSPMLGLLPNLYKPLYTSSLGIALAFSIIAQLVWGACRSRAVLTVMTSFLICLLPWVLVGNPSSRYFYLPMAFLYTALVITLSNLRRTTLAARMLLILMGVSLIWTYQRASLWKEGYDEAVSIQQQLSSIAATYPRNTQFVVANLPDVYGPEWLPLRTQVWNSGISNLVPNVQQVRTTGSPNIWPKAAGIIAREQLLSKYPDRIILEVVPRNEDHHVSYQVIPFATDTSQEQGL